MLDSNLDLRGRRAVVTGASSGIGRALALELAREGCDLVVAARREDRLDELAKELVALGVRAELVAVDLAAPGGVDRLVAAATSAPVHVLVNNAGVGLYGPFRDQSWAEKRAVLMLNVVALTELTHHFVGHMLAHGQPSGILNVSSISAFQATPSFAVYGPSKSYVRDFSESLAYELADANVRVTCLCPGGTVTEFSDHAGQTLKGVAEHVMMDAEDVARIGIRALRRGRRTVVAGGVNKVSTLVTRFMPRRVSAWMADFAMRQAVDVADPTKRD
ncbi:MAG: SDR family oxidoreductase [Myxococcota bacterium]